MTNSTRALLRVKDEVANLLEPQFADVPYRKRGMRKALSAFLRNKDVAGVLKDYIDKYNELLAQSKYSWKGAFDFYNAATIAKSLAR